MKLLLLLVPIILFAQTPPGGSGPAKIIGPQGDALPDTPCQNKTLFFRTGVTAPGLYYCREGSWVLPGSSESIAGPAGATGPAGSTGPAGPTGATGAASTIPGPAGAAGADGSGVNYNQPFTAQTTVALTHNMGTVNVITTCYDASEKEVEYDSATATDSNTVTVTFITAQTGRCVVSTAAGAGEGGGGGGISSVTVSSLGSGTKLLVDSTGATVQGKTLVEGTNISFTVDANTITINSTGGGGGGTTYASSTTIIVGTGSNGCPLNQLCINGAVVPLILCTTVNPSWSSIAAGGYAVQNVTAMGFIENDILSFGPHNTLSSAFTVSGKVITADSIELKFRNDSAGALTPATVDTKICTMRTH